MLVLFDGRGFAEHQSGLRSVSLMLKDKILHTYLVDIVQPRVIRTVMSIKSTSRNVLVKILITVELHVFYGIIFILIRYILTLSRHRSLFNDILAKPPNRHCTLTSNARLTVVHYNGCVRSADDSNAASPSIMVFY